MDTIPVNLKSQCDLGTCSYQNHRPASRFVNTPIKWHYKYETKKKLRTEPFPLGRNKFLSDAVMPELKLHAPSLIHQ